MTRKPFVLTNLRHMQPTRQVDRPEPGWFKLRLVKGGVMVAARITYGPPIDPETGMPQVDRSWLWCGEINGEPDPNPTPAPSETVLRIWTNGERIAEVDFKYLLADRQWAAAHAPHLPEAEPKKPVNLREMNPRDLL